MVEKRDSRIVHQVGEVEKPKDSLGIYGDQIAMAKAIVFRRTKKLSLKTIVEDLTGVDSVERAIAEVVRYASR